MGCRVWGLGLGFRVWGFGCRVLGLGFGVRVWGFGISVWGLGIHLGFGVWDYGWGFWGSGFRLACGGFWVEGSTFRLSLVAFSGFSGDTLGPAPYSLFWGSGVRVQGLGFRVRV